MRFERIYLENWRNFNRVDVTVQQRVFLVGPNASGKSNFLDALRFLRDIVNFGGGFQKAVADRGGVSKIRALTARRYSNINIEVDIVDDSGSRWNYRLAINQDNLRRPKIIEERVKQDQKIILARPDDLDREDPERLFQTHLEQVNANREFRDIADFFSSIKYLHLVPQLIREPDRSVGKKADPFGGDFLEQLAQTPKKTREAWLARIRDAMKVAVPQLKDLTLERDNLGTPHLKGLYQHWRPNAGWQTEADFSDGTLRLLGLLWSILDGNGPLLLEEPELSLHSGVVQYVPQMMARVQRKRARQVFVSTHSSDLLSDEGIGSKEVIVLIPSNEGTKVSAAADIQEIDKLLESGLTAAEAVLPRTTPKNLAQLTLFGD